MAYICKNRSNSDHSSQCANCPERVFDLFIPQHAKAEPHTVVELFLQGEHPARGNADLLLYRPFIQVDSIDLFIELYPKARTRPAACLPAYHRENNCI
jgi:hypothetical protein